MSSLVSSVSTVLTKLSLTENNKNLMSALGYNLVYLSMLGKGNSRNETIACKCVPMIS